MTLLPPCLWTMGPTLPPGWVVRVHPVRGGFAARGTRPARGEAGPPGRRGRCAAAEPERPETRPGATQERRMTTFTVWKFETPDGAQHAAEMLKDASSEGLVTIVDHAVV